MGLLRGGQEVPRPTKIEVEIFQVGPMLPHFSHFLRSWLVLEHFLHFFGLRLALFWGFGSLQARFWVVWAGF